MALQTITFRWSDEFGPCYDCGNPAAYVVGDDIASSTLCSVCTAMHVWEGESILRYLFGEMDR